MMDKNEELLLFQYQEARRRLVTCESELTDRDRQKAIDVLKSRVQGSQAELGQIRNECAQLRRANRQLENECQDYEAQLRQLETNLYSGNISTPKELEQLQRRIAEYQKAKAEREETVLSQLYLLEAKEKELEMAQKKGDELQEQLMVAIDEEAKRIATLQKDCAKLAKEVSRLEAVLPKEFKEYYERSAKALRGITIIPIKDNTCGYCHMIISTAVLAKIKKGNSGIIVCENCGRGLFEQK
jgi:predicted  nucleic acid-binding Zn-ribbon protein